MSVKINDKFLSGFITDDEMKGIQSQAELAYKTVMTKNGAGNDFLGWVELPENYDKEEFARIKLAAEKIKKKLRYARRYRNRRLLPWRKSSD